MGLDRYYGLDDDRNDIHRYYGLDGDRITVHTMPDSEHVCISTNCFGSPWFTAEQYTGFITREYERLVNEGVIEKPLHFEGHNDV